MGMVRNFRHYGVVCHDLKSFLCYLSDRDQKIVVNTPSSESTISISVLQSSILGPFMFSVHIIGLVSLVEGIACRILTTQRLNGLL